MKVSDVKFLKLGLTNRCNSKCITCWHSNKEKIPHLFDMDRRIYRHVKEKLFPNLKILDFLSGGEFFMCRYVDEVIDDISKGSFKTTIESNMSMITEDQRDKLAKSGVRFIASLDGSTKELQEELRPQCNYDRVISNIKYFVDRGNRVTIRMTVSNRNFRDMMSMMELGESLGVENVICHGAEILNSLELPAKFDLPPEDLDYVKSVRNVRWKCGCDIFLPFYRSSSMYYKPSRGFYNVMDPMTASGAGIKVKLANLWAMVVKKDCCPIPSNFINIDIDGRVYFCSCPECRPIGVGLHQYTLDQILDHPAFDKARRECSCKISRRFLNAAK